MDEASGSVYNARYTTSATMNMIADVLSDYELLSNQIVGTRPLMWCTRPGGTSSIQQTGLFPMNQVLLLGDLDDMRTFETSPLPCPLLLLLPHDYPFDADDPPFALGLLERTIVIQSSADCISTWDEQLEQVLSKIQMLIFEVNSWASSLNDIILRGGSMQELIDKSEHVFENFMDVNDSTYTMIAHTKHIGPADELSAALIKRGHHDISTVSEAQSMGALTEWKAQIQTEVFEPDELVPHVYVTSVLRSGGRYSGHLVMVCNNRPFTDGLLDRFNILADYCQKLVDKYTLSESQANIFIRRLVGGERLNQSYIDEQLALVGLENAREFRLALIDLQNSNNREQVDWFMRILENSLDNALLAHYQGNILVIFHHPHFNPQATEADFRALEKLCGKISCFAYLSDSYERFRDVFYAHQQALLTRKYRSSIDIELRPFDNIAERRVFEFESAFGFFIYDNNMDIELREFCLNNHVLDHMISVAKDDGANDVKLLYFYLFNECKTSPTAAQLNMHRNNVRYRIQTIERRYGLDLDRFATRQRLLANFRFKILTSSKFRALIT